MKRVLWTLVGLVVMVGVLCLPAAFFGGGSAEENTESTIIRDYRADFTLAADGDLDVTETLAVDFPSSGKHGIFRFWDRSDATVPHARRDPEGIAVTRDGETEPFELSESDHGRFEVAKIGDASRTLDPGVHTFVIRYHIDGVIDPDDRGVTGVGVGAAPSMFYWNLVPSGWQQRIDQAELIVHLPAAAQSDVRCAVGTDRPVACDVQGGGTRELSITTDGIPARTPLSIATALDLPNPPAGHAVPWSARWDRVLGSSTSGLVVIAILALVALVVGSLLGARSREKPPAFPLLYAPPEGIGPAQAAYLHDESIDNKTYIATLMWAAEKGAVDLTRDDKTWTISDKGGAQAWAGLDPVTTSVAHILSGPGSHFTVVPKNVTAGERLKTEITSFKTTTRTWARSSGLLTRSGLGRLGGILAGAALLLTLVAAFGAFGPTLRGLVPGAFAVGGLSLLATGATTRRTRSGRDLWSQIGGFRRTLATPSSTSRFDFAARENIYTTYLPWAVALGCADQWAAKYRTETGSEPPVPHYFAGAYAGASTGHFVDSMVSSFGSTVSSAVSSYTASQSSSGGGFSGGGGGGGGGGGSW